jgi:hypothetical protein
LLLLATSDSWPNDDVEQFRITKTELLIGDSHDTGRPWFEHLDRYPRAQTEFLKPMDLIRLTDQLFDQCGLPSREQV